MSLINLVGNIVTPDYTTLFMVRSEVMVEAEGRGAILVGAVGIIQPGAVGGNQWELKFVDMMESDSAQVAFLDPEDLDGPWSKEMQLSLYLQLAVFN